VAESSGFTPWPSAAMIDSQSVRAADIVARASRCWDNAKKYNGSKPLWRAKTRAEHLTWASILGGRAYSPSLRAYDPVVRLGGAARPQRHRQRRRDLGTVA
jgi:hypothetical protein